MVVSRSARFVGRFFLLKRTSDTAICTNTSNVDNAGKIVFLFMCLEYSERKDMMCEEAISFALRCLEYFQWKDEIC